MAIIAGDTLGELSRNSMVDEGERNAFFLDAVDRARRAYEFGNLSAADREGGRRFDADLGLRGNQLAVQRELGLAPWERGMTPFQSEGLRLNREIAMAPWDRGMTPGEEAQMNLAETLEAMRQRNILETARDTNARLREAAKLNFDLGTNQLATQERLGMKPYGEMTKADAERLRLLGLQIERGGEVGPEAAAAANYADQLFKSQRLAAIPELTKMLDTTWRFESTARDIATRIASGQPLTPDELQDTNIQRAKQYFDNQFIPRIRSEILSTLGEGAGGYIIPTETGFASAFRRPVVSRPAPSQAVSETPPPIAAPAPEPARPQARFVWDQSLRRVVPVQASTNSAPSRPATGVFEAAPLPPSSRGFADRNLPVAAPPGFGLGVPQFFSIPSQ